MVTKPQPSVFEESERETTTGGPDFPGSAGDRERGRFRPSVTPRLTTVAVVGDDGQPVARSTNELLAELVWWQKATVIALMWNGWGEEYDLDELASKVDQL